MKSDQAHPLKKQAKYTLSNIFKLYIDDYLKKHNIPYHYQKIINDIINCGTGFFGFSYYQCDACGTIEVSNNTCNNRHCPSCQGAIQHQWVQTQIENMLPVPYYHVVFTIPALLNDLCRYNERELYNLLFKASAETLKAFGQNEKWLGAELGFFGILHTWGQKGWIHPHVHYIVPGGGLDGEDWKDVKYKAKFLFPVRALSIVFRGKFIEGLKELYYNSKLIIPETMDIPNNQEFEKFIDVLVARNWIAYSKAPFKTPEAVIKYIGYYTHRVAISNNRIKEIENDKITISYKDYKDNNTEKELTLSANDFISRFLLHILPPNFHKIRYYGILANGNKDKLEKARASLKDRDDHNESDEQASKKEEAKYEGNVKRCAICMTGIMVWIAIYHRYFTAIRSIDNHCRRTLKERKHY